MGQAMAVCGWGWGAVLCVLSYGFCTWSPGGSLRMLKRKSGLRSSIVSFDLNYLREWGLVLFWGHRGTQDTRNIQNNSQLVGGLQGKEPQYG